MFYNTAKNISDSPPWVLVVDDDKSSLMWMRLLLQQSGFCVETARTGHEAFRKTERLRPQFIVTDLKLPDFSGVELAERVKNELPATQIFCVSGYAKEVLTPAEHKFFSEYLEKPFDFDVLISLLKENSECKDSCSELTNKKASLL